MWGLRALFAGRALGALLLLTGLCWAGQARANTCAPATSQGTAPPEWQTYCWLDFTGYNDVTAKTAAGQPFTFTLTDGSTLTLTVKTTTANATGLVATTAPSWTGAAVGNSAFIGIPGRPILYTAAAGTTTVALSNIVVTAPAGAGATTAYMFIGADAESTDNSESLAFTTNGGNWIILDQVNPISGNQYPTTTNTGTTFTESGAGLTGNVGGYIVGSTTPTTVSSTMVAGGLEGAMFALRFASLKLNKTIGGARVDPADQFTYTVKSTNTGATLTTGTTSGTGLGPFSSATVSLASGLPLTLGEVKAAGPSTLAEYDARLTCTNASTSSTPLPNNVATTSYNFGALQYGDAVSCAFTNTPQPHLKLTKALGGTRVFTGDQFVMNVNAGATTVATTTTTGTGSTVATGSTANQQVAANTVHTLNEVASGTTNLTYYTSALACTNANAGSTTVLPTTVGGSVTPKVGDVIACTITNNPKPNKANPTLVKTSVVVSDPINGTTNPKMIPGAVVRYSITVTNAGTGPIDTNTVVLVDPLPTNVSAYVAGTAVTFADGTPASGLTYAYASNVSWSKTVGGTTGFGAALTPDANGYDAAVTGVRIAPGGIMAAATAAGQPSFTVSFNALVK